MGDYKDLEDIAKTATDDFYALLDITTFDPEESEIKRAYRKASVRVHPDKNIGDATAADKFIRLGIARDILLDPKLKTEYDRQRLRKREKALQDEKLHGKRREMKEDLERREREFNLNRKRRHEMSEEERRQLDETEKCDIDIQRLAEKNKRRRMEFQEKMEKQRQEEEASFVMPSPQPEAKPQAPAPGQTEDIDRTIKVRFLREGEQAAWDKDKVSSMFAKYGEIDIILMGKDKKVKPPGEKHKKMMATVVITYTRLNHAHAAVTDGKWDWPLLESVTWAGKEPELVSPTRATFSAPSTPKTPSWEEIAHIRLKQGAEKQRLAKQNGNVPKFSFSPKTPVSEEATATRLKQAERKRLEEQIREQEAAEDARAKEAERKKLEEEMRAQEAAEDAAL